MPSARNAKVDEPWRRWAWTQAALGNDERNGDPPREVVDSVWDIITAIADGDYD